MGTDRHSLVQNCAVVKPGIDALHAEAEVNDAETEYTPAIKMRIYTSTVINVLIDVSLHVMRALRRCV